MRALSILGTSSNAGKSWVATALCAWLRRQGVNVAPFKAQNMANNAYATLEGGEIGVAQAVQAEACGRRPIAEMNPIVLKPSGRSVSQVVRLGEGGEHLEAWAYYKINDEAWELVRSTIDYWRTRCDVLVMEGAGSPVEVNLMERDIVNLRPIEETDGRWLLVSNIEQGGVFAQVCGTWMLLPETMKRRGLGFLVNRFRGDLSLFETAGRHFNELLELPYMGTLPLEDGLLIDDEDSLNARSSRFDPGKPYLAWVKYPQVSNTQDQLPWSNDSGIQSIWTADPEHLRLAAGIVLPGTKNTILDLKWMREVGLCAAIKGAGERGVPVIGICGGLQILGERISDAETGETVRGLSLLPVETVFRPEKTVTRRIAVFGGDEWETFEIHMGQSRLTESGESLGSVLQIRDAIGELQSDGFVRGKVWGTYQHGLFESPALRRRLVDFIGLDGVEIDRTPWNERRQSVYAGMADVLERFANLEAVKGYLDL